MERKINLDITAKARLDRFEKDMLRLEKLITSAESRAITIPVRLSFTGLRKQTAALVKEINQSVRQAQSAAGGEGMSAGGIAIPAASLGSLERAQGKVISQSRELVSQFNTLGETTPFSRSIQQTEIMEAGLRRVTTLNQKYNDESKKFENQRQSERLIDNRPLLEFSNTLDAVRQKQNQTMGRAVGLKDTQLEIESLTSKYQDLQGVLDETDRKGQRINDRFRGESPYRKAEQEIGKIQERIARLRGSDELQDRLKQDAQALDTFRRASQEALGTRGTDMGRARGLRDTDTEMQILTQRAERLRSLLTGTTDQKIIDSNAFRAAERSLDSINEKIATLGGRAEKATAIQNQAVATRNLNQQLLAQERLTAAQLKGIDTERSKVQAIASASERQARLNQLREQEQKILRQSREAYTRIQTQATGQGITGEADKADRRLASVATQERQRLKDFEERAAQEIASTRQRGLADELAGIKRRTSLRLEELNGELKTANAIERRRTREQEVNRILQARQKLIRGAQQEVNVVRSQALQAGESSIARQALTEQNNLAKQAIRTQNSLAAATRGSGHAFDFHSGSLLRNAATVARWQAAVSLVLGSLRAVSSGVRTAIENQKQYAMLTAVFQGSADEAKRLQQNTLELSAANGVAAREAMDAAIAYSRLGLTRVEVTQLVETSLRAANVAEMEAGEATKNLIAIYKAFNLEVGEVSATLDRLNGLANRYAVTVKDLFEGVARAGATALQAGLAETDLEGIITSVTAATGRPAAEIGNAMKFIMDRIRRPDVLNTLQEAFDIDLREASGEIKDMSQILNELADIYPTLTRTQQAWFLNVSAGARQANRFALVLDHWREGQVAVTRALSDFDSVARENEKITASLASQIESLKNNWTDLAVTLGDAGVFNFASGLVSSLSSVIRDLSDQAAKAKRAAEDPSGSITIPDRGLQTDITNLLGDAGIVGFVDQETRSVEELQKALKNVTLIKNQLDRSAGKGIFERYRQAMGTPQELIDDLGFTRTIALYADIFLDTEDAQARADQLTKKLKGLLDEKDITDYANNLAEVTTELNNIRAEADAFEKAQSVIRGLMRDIQLTGADLGKTGQLFNDLRDVIERLPDGTTLAAEIFPDFNKAISESNIQEVMDIFTKFIDLFGKGTGQTRELQFTTAATGIEKLTPALQKAEQDINRINQAIAAQAGDPEAQAKLRNDLQKTEDQYNSIRRTIDEVRKAGTALTKALESQSSEFSTRIRAFQKYFDAMTKPMTEALKSLSIEGTDTPERTYERELAAERLRLNLLQEQLDATTEIAKENLKVIEARQHFATRIIQEPGFDPETRKAAAKELEILKTQESLQRDSQIASQKMVHEERERLKIAQQNLEAQREAAKLQAAFQQSIQATGIAMAQFDFGRDPTDRLLNILQGSISSQFWETADMDLHGPPDDLHLAERRAAMLERERSARQALNDLELRGYQISAEIKQNEIDRTEEMVKQREERSRSLSLADRENQLRAAATAAAIAQGGGFSRQEFMFLSQATRQNINQFNPESAPFLDTSGREFSRNQSRLANEQQRVEDLVPRWEEVIRTFSERLDRILPPQDNSRAIQNSPIQDIVNPRDPQQIINLNLNGIEINMEFGEQIDDITTAIKTHVDQRLDSWMMNQIRPFESIQEPANAVAI